VWVVVGLSITVLVTVAVSRMKTEGGWRWRNGQD
jgi:hypothetical protein